MPISIHLNGETARYLAAFSIAAILVKAERILVFHRPADLPHTVDAIWWLRAADAERVVKRARALGRLTDAPNAVMGAARDLGVGLTAHDDLLRRVRAATQRIASDLEHARMAGHLRDFNRRYKVLRLQAQSEGRPFMSYEKAKRRLRGALATKAAAIANVVKADTRTLLAQVFETEFDG
jgi:hypothetical protein